MYGKINILTKKTNCQNEKKIILTITILSDVNF